MALGLALALHVTPLFAMYLGGWNVLPSALRPYGDGDVLGLPTVSTIALAPGTLEVGDSNTEGGSRQAEPPPTKVEPLPNLPEVKPQPAPKVTPPPARVPELTPPEEKKPTPPAVVAEPVQPPAQRESGPVARVTQDSGPTSPSTTAVTQPPKKANQVGTPGGSRLPIGTPSAGGTPGVSNGVRIAGLPRLIYPQEALLQGIEGRVVVLLSIDVEGRVHEARLHRSSGHEILDDAALVYAKAMRFLPAQRGGTPVETTVTYPIRFELSGRQ